MVALTADPLTLCKPPLMVALVSKAPTLPSPTFSVPPLIAVWVALPPDKTSSTPPVRMVTLLDVWPALTTLNWPLLIVVKARS
jgi:hypothetical protein